MRNCSRIFTFYIGIMLSAWNLAASTIESMRTNASRYPRDDQSNCPDEYVYNSTGYSPVLWSTAGSPNHRHISSNPLCLDKMKYPITRDCINGEWTIQREECVYTLPSFAQSERCPLGMTNVYADPQNTSKRSLCVKLLPSAAWSGVCAETGASVTIDDLDAVDLKALTDFAFKLPEFSASLMSFWLPANWVRANSIRWLLPGRFGEVQLIDTKWWPIGQPTFQGKGCLHAQLFGSRYIISNQPCTRQYPMLCMYAEDSPLLQLACPDGYAATRYKGAQSDCYSTESTSISRYFENENLQLFRMNSAERTVIASKLPVEFCTFNPIDSSLQFKDSLTSTQWEALDKAEIEYVNWHPLFEPNHLYYNQYLVLNSHAEWQFNEKVYCALVNQTIEIDSPKIWLSHNSLSAASAQKWWLQVGVININSIWHEASDVGIHCFHSKELGSPETAIIITANCNKSADYVSYDLHDIDDGFYWCEAYTIGQMEHIVTPTVYIDVADTFAGSVARQCPCLESFINIQAWFEEALAQSTHEVRISDIELVRSQPFQIGQTDFIQIWFRASVQSMADDLVQENDVELLKIMDHRMLRVWRKQEILEDILSTAPLHFPVVNSTEYCLPEVQTPANTFVLLGAQIGQTRTPAQLCLLESGLPVVLLCDGDSRAGAAWTYLTDSTCSTANPVSVATRELYDMNANFQHANQTAELFDRVQNITQHNNLTSIDLYSIGNIMERASRLSYDTSLEIDAVNDMFSIYDQIMSVGDNVTRDSSILNTTNVLLAAFEDIVQNLLPNTCFTQNTHFQTHIIDPERKNVTGLALYKNNVAHYLLQNQSVEDMLSHPDLVVAVFIPEALLAHLPRLSKLIVTVFNNDAIFQAPNIHKQKFDQIGKIIGLSIPNVDTDKLPEPIPIFFKYTDQHARHSAGFWVPDNRQNWARDGLQLASNTSSIFQFNVTHLTNFALLIREGKDSDIENSRTLFLITLIGSSVSLISICCIFITAIRYSSWRQKASNQLLVQLSLALALMLILFSFAGTKVTTRNVTVCITLGAILHYLVLVNFMWMLVMAYLQFMRYVIVFIQLRSDRYVLKLSCISWTVPLIPVIVLLTVDPQLYVPQDENFISENESICYPTGMAMLLALVMPVSLILLCNLLIFVVVIYNLLKIQKSNRSIMLAQLRVTAFLFFLLGLTWIFGLLSYAEGFGLVFTYLFCATGSLQGFVLFVYFVLLEPGARKLWAKDIKIGCGVGRHGSMSVDTLGSSKQSSRHIDNGSFRRNPSKDEI